MIDLTSAFQLVVAVCVIALSAFIVPALRNKLDADQLDLLCKWVKIAVAAAEQLFDSNEGRKKKEYVLTFLRNKGYDVNESEIEQAVEAAVLELHSGLYGGTGK